MFSGKKIIREIYFLSFINVFQYMLLHKLIISQPFIFPHIFYANYKSKFIPYLAYIK